MSASLFVRCLSVLCALAFAAAAQVRPPRPALDNFDLRQTGAKPAEAQSAAVTALRSRLSGASVSFDAVTAAPKFVGSTSGFLTGPQGEGGANLASVTAGLGKNEPLRAVYGFLDSNPRLFGHGSEALAAAKVTRDYVTARNGMRSVVWQQQVGGIPVFEALLSAHVTRNGELVTIHGGFSTGAPSDVPAGVTPAAFAARPKVGAAQAIAAAAGNVGEATLAPQLTPAADRAHLPEWSHFTGEGIVGEASVRQVWVPMGPSSLRLGWEVLFTSAAWNEMFRVVVDAEKGQPILRHRLTADASPATYRVFTSDSPSPFSPGHQTPQNGQPPLTNRELVTITSVSPVASPNGWINDGDNETLGNNVEAHLDTDRNNIPDLPRPMGNPARTFDPPLDLTMDPAGFGDSAVVNLFYWNNVIHDRLYDLGFTEAAGNFQTDNFGRGGAGNDAVQADAQDGSGFNNANFSTPPDGFPGRMQMFLFNFPTPARDGDYDQEVIIHEYVHGLSNRRVGGGVGISALQTAGMGEGWSDFYGLCLLSDPSDNPNSAYAMGGYLTLTPTFQQNYYFGIRRYPKSTDITKNPLTLKDIDPTQASAHPGIPINPFWAAPNANSVHNQGEVWCAALWDARANLIARYGGAVGNQLILQIVTDALALSPANATFIEARDAVLLADLVNNGGANRRELGLAFAKRGMGAGATVPPSFTTVGVKESFEIAGLELVARTLTDSPSGNGDGFPDPGETALLNFHLRNTGFIGLSNVVGTLSTVTPGVSVAVPIANFGSIPEGVTASNTVPFRFRVDPAVACGTPVQFRLVTTSTGGNFTNVFTQLVGQPVVIASYTNSFEAPGLPGAIPDVSTNEFALDVSLPVETLVADINVSLRIDHTFIGDLNISLVAPDGTVISLSQYNGGLSDAYGTGACDTGVRTTFDDSAAVRINVAVPPYAGSFRPDGALTNFAGFPLNGTWKLRVSDDFQFDSGQLLCWGMEVVSVEQAVSCTPFVGAPEIVVSATTLQSESGVPPDGAVSSGETITLAVTLRNQGGVPVNALTAAVLPSAGVVPLGGAVAYGLINAGGDEVTRNQTFRVTAAPGSTAVVSLRLIDAPVDLGVITFPVQVSGSMTLVNPAAITINPINAATPYPSTIQVAGMAGLVSKVRVRLNKFQHSFPDDVDVLLVGPAGQKVMLMSDAGGNSALAAGINLTFDGDAPASLPNNSALASGTFRPTDHDAGETLPAPAPAGPYGTALTVFNNQGANGTWSLFVADDADGDAGVITGGWELELTTFNPLNPAGDLAVLATASTAAPLVGLPYTYTVTAMNMGAGAVPVTVSNRLPAGVTLNSNAVSQGTAMVSGATVTAAFGTVAPGGTATLTLNVTATAPGSLTNTASVTGPLADVNPANDTSSVVVTATPPAPIIQAGAAMLLSEGFNPPNGGVDAGEMVMMNFELRNVGSANAVNVQAALLATGGVSAPGAAQNYGTLTPGAPPTARAFTFTAAPTSSVITATLQLTINGSPGGSVQFPVTIGAAGGVTNSTAIVIPALGAASPYPSTIQISGLTGAVTRVTATLHGLTHGFASDLDVLLVGPGGQKVMLMSDAGGNSAPASATLTFDDAAAATLPQNGNVVTGTFKPSNFAPAETLPAPAPAPPYGALLSAFNSTSPNGTWSLFVSDSINGDSGVIAGGWSLRVETVAAVNPAADLRLTALASAASVVAGSNVTYTLTVSNRGPGTASTIVLTNLAPVTAAILAVTPSQGTVTTNGSTVRVNLGGLANAGTATVAVQVRPFAVVNMTNAANVVAALADPVPGDNSVLLTTTVLPPPAPSVAVSGVVGNQFQLNINGVNGVAYVIEASSTLTNWTAISTNILMGSTLTFSDPASATEPTRFYRARVLGQ